MAGKGTTLRARRIEQLIVDVRGHRVLLDEHLAKLYGVTTREVNQSATRNRRRFPEDFAFRLTTAEWRALRSQSVISNESRGGRRYPPRAFTEEGAAMLSSVLRSDCAIDVNVAIMRAFVQVRRLTSGHADLLRRLDALEGRVGAHDAQFQAVFRTIRRLIEGPPCRARGASDSTRSEASVAMRVWGVLDRDKSGWGPGGRRWRRRGPPARRV